MAVLDDARSRVQAVLNEIRQISEFEFPYRGSELALRRLEQVFQTQLATLNTLGPASNPDTLRHACSLALGELYDHLPFLGFVVRSTNVRNAFEVFHPLLRIARDVLEPHVTDPNLRTTQLVLSSEWDYSPFIYIPGLSGFVLIGLPSPESSNPLLVPLAGHELGHSVWMNNSTVRDAIEARVVPQVISVIQSRWPEYQTAFPGLPFGRADLGTDTTAIETWATAAGWAFQQAEETFCDCLGLRLFGNSYLEAFAYLLAPTLPGTRSIIYPNTLDRVDCLLEAATVYHATVPLNYRSQFDNKLPPDLTPQDTFRLSVADEVVRNIRTDIVSQAEQVIAASGLPPGNADEVERIWKRFKRVVPAEGCKSLADIMNAAWKAYRDPDFWRDNAQIAERKDKILKELVLKNVELFEIEQTLGAAP